MSTSAAYFVFPSLVYRVNIVAFDFLGHGESPRPHQPELYTVNEVTTSTKVNAAIASYLSAI